MITWMQRHKKWLITTVWVSTIAFVGAGFVGWGSYDFGKSGGIIAKIGDREASMTSLQNEYNNIYNQYARMFGNSFNQEMAKQLNLEDVAYNSLIQKNLLLSFADEIGLDITDEEVAKELLKIPSFIKDGKFDKETYIKVLAQNRTNPNDFEEDLKHDLLAQKVQKLFTLDTTKSEIENIGQLLFAEDKIKIKIIDESSIAVSQDEAKMKEFYEANKNNYMSANSYELEFYRIPLESATPTDDEIKNFYEKRKNDYRKDDGKIKTLEEAKIDIIYDINVKNTKKSALKLYLKLKKGEASFQSKAVVYEDKLGFSADDLQKISEAKNSTVLKPFLNSNKFVIVKVVNKFPPRPLSYENAKIALKKDFVHTQRKKLLNEKAQKELENFKGTLIGYVNRESIDKINGLDEAEASKFLNELFKSDKKKGIINLDTKAVLFDIVDSRLAKADSNKSSLIKSTISQTKNSEIFSSLLKNLQTRYEIKSYIQGK